MVKTESVTPEVFLIWEMSLGQMLPGQMSRLESAIDVPRNLLWSEKMLSWKNFGSKKNLGPKKFLENKFLSKKTVGPKMFGSKKCFAQKNVVQKN